MSQSRRPGRKSGASSKRRRAGSGGSSGKSKTPFQHLTEMVKWVDLVIEVLDGRVPVSTRHPEADRIFGSCPRLLVITKEDLGDREKLSALTTKVETETGIPSKLLSLKQSGGKSDLISTAINSTREKQERLARKGILPRPMRVCVVGLPNVGKSSLINWLIGKKKTKTGNRPGITQGTQWVRVHPKLELLDTPGILPPVSFTPEVEAKLAMFNLLPAGNYDSEEVATTALELLSSEYPALLEGYASGLSGSPSGLTHIAKSRNFITSGAIPDTKRASEAFLSDLRDGKVGRVTLDSVE